MPNIDSCINGVFAAENIPASSGVEPVRVVIGSFEDPNNYDPDAMTYSLEYHRFYNSGYLLLLMV